MLWLNVLNVLRGGLFVLAHWCGGSLGAAIFLGSVAIRVAMLPLTLPAQRRALRRAVLQRAVAPRIKAMSDKYRRDPRRLVEETNRLYARHGGRPFDARQLLDMLIQLPPGAAIYAVIRGVQQQAGSFLWIADLARPDRLLAGGAAVLAGILAWFGARTTGDASSGAAVAPVIITGVVSFLILSHFSSAVALYSVANSVVGGVERAVAAKRTV